VTGVQTCALPISFTPFVTTLVEELTIGDGVPGFEFISADVDNISFLFTLLGGSETVVLDGIGDAIDGAVSGDFNIFDDVAQFETFNVDDDLTFDLGGGAIIGSTAVENIINNAVAKEDSVINGVDVTFTITGIDQDNVTFEIDAGGATDILIIDGAEEEIAAVADDHVDLANAVNEVGIFDADDTDFIFIGDASTVSDEFADLIGSDPAGEPLGGALNGFVMTLHEAEAVVEELIKGDGIDGVELLNVDNDTATLGLEGNSHDIVVIDNVDLTALTDTAMM